MACKQPQLQRCCKPWQWNYTYGRQAGTCNINAYYLSDPERYADHAKDVIKEDSLVLLEGADEVIIFYRTIYIYRFDVIPLPLVGDILFVYPRTSDVASIGSKRAIARGKF